MNQPLAAPAARERDHVWDALVELFGPTTNQGTRARRNKAVKLIKESLAAESITDPAAILAEIRGRARRWQQLFTSAPLTDIALANGWDRAVRRAPASASRTHRDEPQVEVLPPEENAKHLRELQAAMQSIGREIP